MAVLERDAGLNIPDYPGDDAITEALGKAGTSLLCRVFAQEELCIVLGRGCDARRDLRLDVLEKEPIPVFRRQGGGGTVVLGPGMLIVAVAAHLRDPFGNKRYFQLIQTPLQEALSEDGVLGVEQRGISDLAVEGRKILGSSLRRQGTLLVYQAVLLVDTARDIFSYYLQHPPREPDYREGRDHRDFTTTLVERGLVRSVEELQQDLQTHLTLRLPQLLSEDLVPPPAQKTR
ncbi:MAG: hypothetical protein H6728_17595 [Myxococcales bacterium]|nr:hypothetical protein [Myxococcales bacterium]MCB9644889.1 hypothetical protein [Myxococcales bacterium]